MMHVGYRLAAAGALVGAAALFTGLGMSYSNASGPTPDLTDLRDAVNAAAKRGDNVNEIRKALTALETALANKGWTTPEPGKTVEPPPELVALHDAVEAAARKGENVVEIRTQLEATEKALIGKTLTRPKPQPPVSPPVAPVDPIPPPPFPGNQFPGNQFPGNQFPGNQFPVPAPGFPGIGIDQEALQKAQNMMRKASEMMLKNPDDPEAAKLMQEANDLMLKAMLGGRNGFAPIPALPDRGFPNGRVGDRFRLGVRLERVSELAADQLGLDVARGVGIADVVEGSPAARAGFKKYDIVLEFGGKPVTDSPEDFMVLVQQVKPGRKIDALVMRKGKKMEIKGIEMPDNPQVFPAVRGVREQGERNPLPRELRPQQGLTITVADNNGQVVVKATQNNVSYMIEGKRTADNFTVSKIAVTDGDKTTDYASVDKVPEQYRKMAERLIDGVRAQPLRGRAIDPLDR